MTKLEEYYSQVICCAKEMHTILVTYDNEKLEIDWDYGTPIDAKASPRLHDVDKILKRVLSNKELVNKNEIDNLFTLCRKGEMVC